MFMKILRAFACGAVFALGLFVVPGVTAGLSYFTPPYGANPAQCGVCIPDYATIVTGANKVLSFLTFQNGGEAGEPQILSPQAFAANGSVATSLGSVGPVGSHTTVQAWLEIVDNNGNLRFAPLF